MSFHPLKAGKKADRFQSKSAHANQRNNQMQWHTAWTPNQATAAFQ